MARKGGESTRDKYGLDYLSGLGRKGGSSLKEKYGDDYFKKIRQGIKPSK